RIDIMIDGSSSMQFGEPRTKFDFARRAAAALAFLAVNSLDRVGGMVFDTAIRARIRALGGRGHLQSILTFVEGLETAENPTPALVSTGQSLEVEGQIDGKQIARKTDSRAGVSTDLSAVLRSYQRANPRPGILFVISDFFDPSDFRKEMKLLAQKGFDINLIQALAPGEIDPPVAGDLLLVDSETGETREITINDRVLETYRSMLDQYTASLDSFSRATGIAYTMLTADALFEDLLLKNLIEGRMAE